MSCHLEWSAHLAPSTSTPGLVARRHPLHATFHFQQQPVRRPLRRHTARHRRRSGHVSRPEPIASSAVDGGQNPRTMGDMQKAGTELAVTPPGQRGRTAGRLSTPSAAGGRGRRPAFTGGQPSIGHLGSVPACHMASPETPWTSRNEVPPFMCGSSPPLTPATETPWA